MTPNNKTAREKLTALYHTHFGEPNNGAVLVSAPGRIELAGNHTDHQGGHTISAGLNRRIYALACPNGEQICHVQMEDFGKTDIALNNLQPTASELNTSAALIRGMAAAYAQAGGKPTGFNAVVASEIPVGEGVSSSAAFEVLMGAIIRETSPSGWLGIQSQNTSAPKTTPQASTSPRQAAPNPASTETNTAVGTPHCSEATEKGYSQSPSNHPSPEQLTTLALHGQFAEADYFGKPTGAQDQLASAFGGIVGLDFFGSPPQVTPISADFTKSGYSLVLINSRCDHSRYTAQFNSIPSDMRRVAALFNQNRLVDVEESELLNRFAAIRSTVGDLAAMRALHFFNEDSRVCGQTKALQTGNFESFVRMARSSGASSAMFLQNVSHQGDGSETHQPAMVIQALCAALLGEQGAWRIHGGGFGGSVLAFVPNEMTANFIQAMNSALAYEACSPVEIDPMGLQIFR